jgi:hypothetical protein
MDITIHDKYIEYGKIHLSYGEFKHTWDYDWENVGKGTISTSLHDTMWDVLYGIIYAEKIAPKLKLEKVKEGGFEIPENLRPAMKELSEKGNYSKQLNKKLKVGSVLYNKNDKKTYEVLEINKYGNIIINQPSKTYMNEPLGTTTYSSEESLLSKNFSFEIVKEIPEWTDKKPVLSLGSEEYEEALKKVKEIKARIQQAAFDEFELRMLETLIDQYEKTTRL